jgi:hypothetical protein
MITAVMLSSATSLISLASIAYSAVLNRSDRQRETIQTWTCRFSTEIPSELNLDGQDPDMTNLSFGKMCTESVSIF